VSTSAARRPSIVASIALFALGLLGWPQAAVAAPSPPFTQCPAIGADTGCGLLIDVTDGSQPAVYQDASQGPYDGADDTLIGVVNDSSGALASLPLTSGTNVFSFDGDGLCTYVPEPGCPAAYGYEGPGVTFSGISSDGTSGTVNFSPALRPGETAYFSLEAALALVPPNNIVPGPANGGVFAVQLSGNANEPVIAVNPANPLNIVVAYNHFTSVGIYCGYSASFDGGATWPVQDNLPLPTVPHLQPGVGGDPALAFTPSGRLYAACLTGADDGTTKDPRTGKLAIAAQLFTAVSSDGGRTFSPPRVIVHGSPTSNGYGVQPDQEALATSHKDEKAYVCFAEAISVPRQGQTAILLDRLDSSGNKVAAGSVIAHTGQLSTLGCTADVSPSGRVWVGWWDQQHGFADTAYSDNAATADPIKFSSPYVLGRKRGIDNNNCVTPGNRGTSRHVWVRASPNSEAVGALWEDDGSSGPNLMAAAYNGGAWTPAQQLFSGVYEPALAWGADGTLAAGFYQDPHNNGSALTYTIAQSATPDGSFTHLQTLPAQPSTALTNLSGGCGRFGDYTSVAEINGVPYGAWTDNSSGGSQTVWFGHL
jgi:hypothetical protein